MPLDYSPMIPETEPVRLLDAVLEELDYTVLLRLYSTKGRKSAVPPKILFKVIVFAMLEGVYESLPKQGKKIAEPIYIHYDFTFQENDFVALVYPKNIIPLDYNGDRASTMVRHPAAAMTYYLYTGKKWAKFGFGDKFYSRADYKPK